MLDFVKQFGKNYYSQNLEDGIIEEVLKRFKKKKGVAVEFGASDGFYCSNTANLKGWTKHLYDINPTGEVECKNITPGNVNELPECNLLSIDIDGNDYEVWKAYKSKPSIVIIEINSSFKPNVDHFSLDRGCSYKTMVELGISKGYFLLCHTGNLIFLDEKFKELFPEVTGDPLTDVQDYFNYSWI